MASGIDWFRWHHGSVTDPKFQLVARKAGASLPDVLAVWAYLLEHASAAEFRGCFGDVDCEAIDCLFGFDDGKTDAIMAQMAERKLIADEYVVAWEKRQPKKEDVTAADRKRRQREREHELDVAGNVTHTESRDVTNVSDAVTPMSRHVTPCHDREEERREEVNTNANALVVAGRPATLPNCPHQQVIELYAKHLPELPYPRIWEGQRQQNLAARWRWVLTAKKPDGARYATDPESALSFFDRFFAYVAKSDFLTGRDSKWQGCDLGWLVKAENFSKVISGNYDNKEAA